MTSNDIGKRYMMLAVLHRALVWKKTEPDRSHNGQLPLLEAIARFPGSTQQELAEKLLVTPASVALSAKRLEKAGFICRMADENNRRRNQLTLTETGAAAAEKHRAILNGANEEMLRGFTDAEKETLAGFLDRMIANIGKCSGIGFCMPENEGGTETHD